MKASVPFTEIFAPMLFTQSPCSVSKTIGSVGAGRSSTASSTSESAEGDSARTGSVSAAVEHVSWRSSFHPS